MDRCFFKQRRMLLPPNTNLTVTLTGTWDNSGLFGERYVKINDEIITENGVYTVLEGDTAILHTKISPILGGSEKYGIFVDNKCVRTSAQCVNHGPDYEYLLVSNCTINGQGTVHARGGYAKIDVTT